MEPTEGAAEFFEEENYVGKSVALKEHVATDGDQLDLQVGDVVYVLEQDWESGWWGGHKEGEENTGWFPGTALRLPLEPVGARPAPAAAEGSDAAPGAAAGGAPPAAAGSSGPLAPAGDHCWSVPAAAGRAAACDEGYMRDGRMVASPQGPRTPGAGAPAQGAAAVALVLAGPAAGPGAPAEGPQAEVARLRAEVVGLQGELQQLRRQSSADQGRLRELEQLLSDQEQQLKNRASAQTSLSTEASVLREKLESEKRKSQAQIAANDQMRQRYEEKLREKTEDNRRDKEAARKSIQAEQQKAQAEQHRAGELERQLAEAREEVELLRRERQAVKAEPDVSRRLFDAHADRQRAAPPPAAEPPAATRGRALPKPAEQQAPRQSPLRPRPWLGHARSTENLVTEEGPRRGCVLEKVSIFEERCRSQTPRGRDLAESPGEEWRPARRTSPAPAPGCPTGRRGSVRSCTARPETMRARRSFSWACPPSTGQPLRHPRCRLWCSCQRGRWRYRPRGGILARAATRFLRPDILLRLASMQSALCHARPPSPTSRCRSRSRSSRASPAGEATGLPPASSQGGGGESERFHAICHAGRRMCRFATPRLHIDCANAVTHRTPAIDGTDVVLAMSDPVPRRKRMYI
ncbi:unnamed protein product [Prorocentrum cordatum]|uniref:SH3 domain-containing protein n=1 Tax=Prorocentrum cordatum TaxID=2364126 RepID=A0ABN9RN19_9DINO|nr:unnamed protein product [Polarella glacialis]